MPYPKEFISEPLPDHRHTREIQDDTIKLFQSSSESPGFAPAQELPSRPDKFNPRSASIKIAILICVFIHGLKFIAL